MRDTLLAWWADPAVRRLILAGVGVLVVLIAMRVLRRSLGRMIADSEARYRARKVISLLGYLAVILVVLVVYSNKLGALTVTLGVAGAGVAFALQEVIASFAGWFAISFASYYKTGDRVQLGGIKGDVIDIGVLRTTIMEVGEWVKGDLYTGRVVRVANSFVFKEPVFNYSGDFPFLWDEIVVPIKYGCDWQEACRILERAAADVVGQFAEGATLAWEEIKRKYLVYDAQVEPLITLVANDNWIEFTVRYAVDYKSRRWTKHRLFTRILEDIDATGGRVGIASATFHLVEAPVVDVRLRSGPAAP